MSGTWGGVGRIAAMGLALALVVLLVLAAEAGAGKYTVAQCGWYVGAADGAWADTTGGVKFRGDAYCVPPAGADPFDGVHLKSFTREGAETASGNRYGRWSWIAPAGTGITQVRGTWWHVLHDGFEQRIGATAGGAFAPAIIATATDVTPRAFAIGFPIPVAGIEDRLLCARAESKYCSLAPASWSATRALTFTLEDGSPPAAGIGGGLFHAGWHRGPQPMLVWAGELGSGVRYGETTVDGARAAFTEYPCAKALIGGAWTGTRLLPCPLGPSATHVIETRSFSDGPHAVSHCVTDFSGNVGCDGPYVARIDNNAPGHVRDAGPEGGAGWRRQNEFDVSWINPDQGVASPIAGAGWRLTGPGGFDGGAQYAAGAGRTALENLKLPRPGQYSLSVWLRDEAGNEAPGAAVSVPLRFDDVPPGVAFLPSGAASPSLVEAEVSDAHSGPLRGELLYRRADSEHWTELPAKLVPTAPGAAVLRAPLPDLGPGTYRFRADAVDGAGNTASTGRRADGIEMAIGRPAAAEVARAKTRLFARLQGGRGRGETLTVRFGHGAAIGGRLVDGEGTGLAGRRLRVVSRPSRGALAGVSVETLRTGDRGAFELRLRPGASRRISVNFAGDGALAPSTRRPLELRVRSGVSLRVDRTRLTTGQALRLSGQVRSGGAAIPRRGKLVAIQYFEQETRRWRPVVLTRSDHSGHFRARYRFRYISGTAEVRLRATALAEERWPYAPGSSAPVTVGVSGK